tara:strand:- start:280 stop:534 length:255 start_codon:yes stop_codon:yes gene_type:complete
MSKQTKDSNIWRYFESKLKESPLVKFIKQYPRVSLVIGIILCLAVLALPLSLKDKILLPLRAIAVGLIIASAVFIVKLKKLPRD